LGLCARTDPALPSLLAAHLGLALTLMVEITGLERFRFDWSSLTGTKDVSLEKRPVCGFFKKTNIYIYGAANFDIVASAKRIIKLPSACHALFSCDEILER
jgi:hypothetical protein